VWYVQGQMVAEIWVQRGTTYRLQSYGGINHPLYVTSEPVGGFIEKPFSEQAVCIGRFENNKLSIRQIIFSQIFQGITNFAGERAEGGALTRFLFIYL
jgi:hypothetical protein